MIETKRLQLREFQERDLDDVFEFASNPNVAEPAGWKPHISYSDTYNVYDRVLRYPNEWAIVLKETNKVIGTISLGKDLFCTDKNILMIGYLLNEDYWNHGYTKEALFKLLSLLRKNYIVVAYHFPGNIGSKKVLEALGFKQTLYIPAGFTHYSGKRLGLLMYQKEQ